MRHDRLAMVQYSRRWENCVRSTTGYQLILVPSPNPLILRPRAIKGQLHGIKLPFNRCSEMKFASVQPWCNSHDSSITDLGGVGLNSDMSTSRSTVTVSGRVLMPNRADDGLTTTVFFYSGIRIASPPRLLESRPGGDSDFNTGAVTVRLLGLSKLPTGVRLKTDAATTRLIPSQAPDSRKFSLRHVESIDTKLQTNCIIIRVSDFQKVTRNHQRHQPSPPHRCPISTPRKWTTQHFHTCRLAHCISL